MDIRKALTTRWQRLKLGANTLAAGMPEPMGAPRIAGDAHEVVTPFSGQPSLPRPPTESHLMPVASGGQPGEVGFEALVLASWEAFFGRFRPDEREFELPHYHEAGAVVRARLDRLGHAQPDVLTCRMMIDLQMQFEESRFRDFNDRLEELMASCQQLRAQLDVSELSKCYQEDELVNCLKVLKQEFARRHMAVPSGPDGLPARAQDMLKVLLAAMSAAPAAAAVAAAPAPAAATPVPAEVAAPPVDIHARDSLDWTKLHSAAFYGRVELVELLISQGADVNARAKDGSTPLHLAAKKGHLKVAKFLFTKGANISAKDNEGNTVLHLAADAFSPESVQALVAMGSYVNVKNNDGWTPLHLAANRGKQEVIDLLITLGAELNATASNGWTPLKVAVNSGHLQVSEALRQRGGRQ